MQYLSTETETDGDDSGSTSSTIASITTVDMDEVECIVANLIFSGKVKGYISHQKSMLVLSKQDPFPIQAIVKK